MGICLYKPSSDKGVAPAIRPPPWPWADGIYRIIVRWWNYPWSNQENGGWCRCDRVKQKYTPKSQAVHFRNLPWDLGGSILYTFVHTHCTNVVFRLHHCSLLLHLNFCLRYRRSIAPWPLRSLGPRIYHFMACLETDVNLLGAATKATPG